MGFRNQLITRDPTLYIILPSKQLRESSICPAFSKKAATHRSPLTRDSNAFGPCQAHLHLLQMVTEFLYKKKREVICLSQFGFWNAKTLDFFGGRHGTTWHKMLLGNICGVIFFWYVGPNFSMIYECFPMVHHQSLACQTGGRHRCVAAVDV